MGLGKSLTTLALVATSLNNQITNTSVSRVTLIVSPLSSMPFMYFVYVSSSYVNVPQLFIVGRTRYKREYRVDYIMRRD